MQMVNNQKSYAARGWTTYPNGADIPTAESISQIVPIDDWEAGQEPAWAPIAGGKGFGTPERSKGPPPALYPGQSTENAARGGGSGSSDGSDTETGSGSNSNSSGTPSSIGAHSSTSRSAVLPSSTGSTSSNGPITEFPISGSGPLDHPDSDEKGASDVAEGAGAGDGGDDECEADSEL